GRIRALATKAPGRRDWLDINDTVREVLMLAQGEVHGKRVALQTRLAGALPPGWGDRIQVQPGLLNLVLDAFGAMSGVEDGPSELGVSTDRGSATDVVITVRDTGPGLDPQSVARLFDAFYTTKAAGLGMGLAISRSIVESHGGRLWATGNVPRGAVFQFTLPTAREEVAGRLRIVWYASRCRRAPRVTAPNEARCGTRTRPRGESRRDAASSTGFPGTSAQISFFVFDL